MSTKMNDVKEFVSIAPGRICLFGEHQDYLGLPVIAAAIGLHLTIEVSMETPSLSRYKIIMPDLDQDELINRAMPLVYQHGKDYLRSVMKVLGDEGVELPGALTAVVRSGIPIAAGTSSSSAFTDAWAAALLHAAGRTAEAHDPQLVARLAHRAEVIEFKESGGMMDQLSIAHGGVCRFEFTADPPRVTPLKAKPEGFVLGDSCQPKDTQALLSRVRGAAEGALKKMQGVIPDFDYMTASLEAAAEPARKHLDEEECKVLLGNLRNRDILREAFELLSREAFDVEKLGALLTEHHGLLRDNLGISTPRVEAMMDAALAAGALGGKINGSGGGGCMFVLAPGREAEVSEAMEKAGGKAYPVPVSDGVTIRTS